MSRENSSLTGCQQINIAMSSLPSDFPQLPRSVDGQELPDFINAKIIERDVRLPNYPLPDRFDFSIKKSQLFGVDEGSPFDEGAKWFPLKSVQFTTSLGGISSYRALYGRGHTALFGSIGKSGEYKIILDKDEYITGLSGESSRF